MVNVALVEVGKPGPPGTGVTVGAWNQARADIDALQAAPHNLQSAFILRTAGGGSYSHGSNTAVVLGDPLWSIARVDPARYYEVVVWGEALVDVPAGKQAYTRFEVKIAGAAYYLGDFFTSNAGTNQPAMFSGGVRVPPSLPGYVDVGVRISTLDTTPCTWKNVRIWGYCRQTG